MAQALPEPAAGGGGPRPTHEIEPAELCTSDNAKVLEQLLRHNSTTLDLDDGYPVLTTGTALSKREHMVRTALATALDFARNNLCLQHRRR